VAAAALILVGTVMLANRHAVAAHFADGTRGTFVVEDVFCQQRCTWSGFFYRDPQARGTWFTMAAGPGQTIRGRSHQVPAIDVGDPNQVYPLGGGSGWAEARTVAIATTAVACSLIAAVLLRRWRSRRYPRAAPTDSPPSTSTPA
jgi:hypothetical protein